LGVWLVIDGFRIYVLHILAELAPGRRQSRRGDLWSFAPAQDRDKERHTLFQWAVSDRAVFRLPITVGRMTAEHGKLRAEIVELSVER
jgi:hypothetical protein